MDFPDFDIRTRFPAAVRGQVQITFDAFTRITRLAVTVQIRGQFFVASREYKSDDQTKPKSQYLEECFAQIEQTARGKP